MANNNNNVEFIDVSLQGDYLTPSKFERIIKEMRLRLGVTFTRNRPVLPPTIPENDPQFAQRIRWFDIRLNVNDQTRVTLRLRRDTLYLCGFRANDTGNWYEFQNPNDARLIDPQSVSLGFDHNYHSILYAAGLESLTEVPIGQTALTAAATSLSRLARPNVNRSEVRQRAKALLTCILMFCEAARLDQVLQMLAREFVRSSSLRVPEWMESQVRQWQDLSLAVLNYDAGRCPWRPQTIHVEECQEDVYRSTTVVANTVEEVLRYLALLQRDPSTLGPDPDACRRRCYPPPQ